MTETGKLNGSENQMAETEKLNGSEDRMTENRYEEMRNVKRRFYEWNPVQKKSIPCSIHEAFPFLSEKGHIVSFVGAGGKTTLMTLAALDAASHGKKVLVMTTTHIAFPKEDVYAEGIDEIRTIWRQSSYAVIGTPESQNGIVKLVMPEQTLLQKAMPEADLVLIEADGAKRYPCKVPAAHEPVLLPESDLVIGVIGMQALGRPVDEAGFRLSDMTEFLRLSRQDGMQKASSLEIAKSCFTESDFAAILSSECGTKKNVMTGKKRAYYVCMNQCDDEGTEMACDKIAGMLTAPDIKKILITGESFANA